MSVPDPSTTFLDIGTDSSMYEDDPFKIENLLPSSFNMNQLDHNGGESVNLAIKQQQQQQQQQCFQQQQQAGFSQGASAASAIGMSLFPETTISPIQHQGAAGGAQPDIRTLLGVKVSCRHGLMYCYFAYQVIFTVQTNCTMFPCQQYFFSHTV